MRDTRPAMLVVHPHFHPRRTGVTAHTELIVPALGAHHEARIAGGAVLDPALPRITLGEVLARAAREPVIWHAHRNNELLTGLALRAARPKLRVVATSHNPYPPGRYSRFLYRRADALVTLNDVCAQWVRCASRVVHHGVDLRRFRPPSDRAQAFAALGLPGERAVGVVGRVRENKGQGDFAAAMEPLWARFAGWSGALVGLVKPSEQAWADGLVARSGGRLHLAGERKDVVPTYQGLSVLVHPSYREAFSMVLIEAMACGVCVIASALPHVPQVIDDGRNGLLFPPGDVGALRAQLERALADPALVRRLGQAAAEDAARRFGVEQEAEALSEVYEAALRRAPPAS